MQTTGCSSLHRIADVVLSGSEDGTVREVDVRLRPPPLNRTQELQPASDDHGVIGGHIGRCRAQKGFCNASVAGSSADAGLPQPAGMSGMQLQPCVPSPCPGVPNAPIASAPPQWTSGRSALEGLGPRLASTPLPWMSTAPGSSLQEVRVADGAGPPEGASRGPCGTLAGRAPAVAHCCSLSW